MMAVTNKSCERACIGYLEHFFSHHHDASLQKRVHKAFRLLTASEKPLLGKPAGWTAGLIYAVVNRDRQPCGMPGMLNSEFESIFSVSMETVRRRAAQIAELLAW